MNIDLFIIAVYLIATLIVGFVTGYKTKTMRDYSVAGRNFSTPVMVATIFATWLGGGSTIGLTEKVFKYGFIFVIIYASNAIEKIILGKFIIPRMGEFEDLTSPGDIMDKLYGKAGRIITGISSTLVSIGFVGAQVSAIGYIFHYFLGASHLLGILIGAGVVVIYSSLGGIRAVTITDVIQFCILIVAIPLIAVIAIEKIGGYPAFFTACPESHFRIFPEDGPLSKYISLCFIFAIPLIDPTFLQRILMCRNLKQASRSMYIAAATSIPVFTLIGFIGLAGLILYPNVDSYIVFPHLVNSILPSGIKGFAIAGMLAVIMSTADSFLNVASISIVHDVIVPLLKNPISDLAELKLARCSSFILGSLSIIAAVSAKSIVDIVLSALDFWGPIVVAPLLAGIFGLRGSVRAFILAVIAGVLFFLFWDHFIAPKIEFDGILPSMVVNVLVLGIITFFEKRSSRPYFRRSRFV